MTTTQMRLAYFLCCALPILTPAQVTFLKGQQHLRGTVGPYAVTMDVDGGDGYYSYDRIGQPILLQGRLAKGSEKPVALCEAPGGWSGENCFTGHQSADGTFRGVFKSTRTYPVTLRPAPEDEPLPLIDSTFSDSRRLPNGNEQAVSFSRLTLQGKHPRIDAALERDYFSLAFQGDDRHRAKPTAQMARDEFWEQAADQSASLFFRPIVAWNARGLLSVAVFYQTVTGSGHGDWMLTHVSYDLTQDKMLTLADLLRPGSEAEFEAIFQKAVRREVRVKPGEKLPYKYSPANRFLMTPKGITFGSDHEPAWASGHLDFFVPFTELEPILRPETKRFRR